MITDAILTFVAWLVETVVGWLPTVPVPSWLGDGSGSLGSILAQMGQLSVWLPVAFGIQVLIAVLACVIAGFGIKIVRSIASYFLAGGGSSG
ncbi:hypothetical protein [Cellulomonas hominis]